MAANDKALANIATCDDDKLLRKWISAGVREGDRDVEMAARRRLAEVAPTAEPGTVEHAFWSMVETVEQLRRDQGRSNWRMNYLRRAQQNGGVIHALTSCVRRETPGFREVIGYGLPELTAEAIVLRHLDEFDAETVRRAEARLATLDPPYRVRS